MLGHVRMCYLVQSFIVLKNRHNGRCGLCKVQLKSVQVLRGHERSKQHLGRLDAKQLFVGATTPLRCRQIEAKGCRQICENCTCAVEGSDFKHVQMVQQAEECHSAGVQSFGSAGKFHWDETMQALSKHMQVQFAKRVSNRRTVCV